MSMRPFACELENDLNVLPSIILRSASQPISMLMEMRCRESYFQLLKENIRVRQELFQKAEFIKTELYESVSQITDKKIRNKLLSIKRDLHNEKYESAISKFQGLVGGVSTDLVKVMEELGNLAQSLTSNENELKSSYEESMRLIRKKLLGACENSEIQEGILLTSAEFLKGAEKYSKSCTFDEGIVSKEQKSFEKSFMAHLARVCSKTTPRGLLTHVAFGAFDRKMVNLDIKSNNGLIKRRYTMLRRPILYALCEELNKTSEIWKVTHPRVNITLNLNDGSYEFLKNESNKVVLCAVQSNVVLDAILRHAYPRHKNGIEILTLVQKELQEYSIEELEQYYLQLDNKEIINLKLEIPTCEVDGVVYLIEKLDRDGDRLRNAAVYLEKLRSIRGVLLSMDESL